MEEEELEVPERAARPERHAAPLLARRAPTSLGQRSRAAWLSGAVRSARRAAGAGADWVEENPGTALVALGAVVATWLLARRSCAPAHGGYVVGGGGAGSGYFPAAPSSADLGDLSAAARYYEALPRTPSYYPAAPAPTSHVPDLAELGDLAAVVHYYEALARTPSYYPPPRTGIQSTQMSDPRYHYDVPAHFEDWGPGPLGGFP